MFTSQKVQSLEQYLINPSRTWHFFIINIRNNNNIIIITTRCLIMRESYNLELVQREINKPQLKSPMIIPNARTR